MEQYAPKSYCIGLVDIPKDITYLGYKKSAAYLELKNTILAGLLDKALFWATELAISGNPNRLYESICLLGASDVNITNPNIPSLLWQVYNIWTQTSDGVKKQQAARFHDYQLLRNHLCQLVTVLSLSPKAKLSKLPTWKRDSDMDLTKFRYRIRRNCLSEITDIVKINDSKEVYIPLNEIDWAINSSKDVSQAKSHFLFWLGWLCEMERRFPNKDFCAKREVPGIPDNCSSHCAWPVWQIIFKRLDYPNCGVGLRNAVVPLYKLFRTGYQKSRRRSRCSYLIFAAQLTLGSVPAIDFSTPIFPKLDTIILADVNVNQIYKRILDQKRQERLATKSDKGNISNVISETREILYIPRIK